RRHTRSTRDCSSDVCSSDLSPSPWQLSVCLWPLQQTEAVYGSLPFNRALVAKAIDRLTAAKAKGIVIKFFYDLPSAEINDHLLEIGRASCREKRYCLEEI